MADFTFGPTTSKMGCVVKMVAVSMPPYSKINLTVLCPCTVDAVMHFSESKDVIEIENCSMSEIKTDPTLISIVKFTLAWNTH